MEEQKELLSKYFGSFMNDATEFNFYLNEEIGRLKEVISEGFQGAEIQADAMLQEKLESVATILADLNQKPIGKEQMVTLLKIQGLAKELS